MSKKSKVLFLFGTRPEIIRLSSIINKAKKYCDVKLLNTSQNFDPDLNKIFLQNFDIKIDFDFKFKSSDFIEFFGKSFLEIKKLIKNYKPDKVVTLGDTNSALLSYVFKRMKIPIYHIEAGNRSFDENIPEETNRKIVDHFSDYNFVYSERARLNLLKEGLSQNKIFLIGSPLLEVFKDNYSHINKSNILKKLKIKKKEFILVSFHRFENINNKIILSKFIDLLEHLEKVYYKKIIVSFHPSLKSKITNMKIKSKNIMFVNPFSYFDYCKLQINSFITLSDSGSISEESKILNFKSVSLRYSIERQEATESGFSPISGLNTDSVVNLINFQIKENNIKANNFPQEYQIDNSSSRFLNILLGANYK